MENDEGTLLKSHNHQQASPTESYSSVISNSIISHSVVTKSMKSDTLRHMDRQVALHVLWKLSFHPKQRSIANWNVHL